MIDAILRLFALGALLISSAATAIPHAGSTDRAGRVTSQTYDALDRLTKVTYADGKFVENGYEAAGRLTSVTQPDPTGARDANGVSLRGPVTTYAYDEPGNKVSQTDALNRITRWEYDALGRTTRRTLPGGQFETFTYNAVGNVSQHTTFNGEVISFTYDALNRLATKSLPAVAAVGTPATVVSYTYTPTGQVASVEDTRGITTYQYDGRDRLTQVSVPEGWVTTYQYDAAGNRTHVTTRFGSEAPQTTVHEFDRAGRLTKVTSPEGEVTVYTYDAAGNRKTASLPNGTSIAWTYDARNRLTKVEHKKVSTNAILASSTYTWNAQGLRAREDGNLLQLSSSCRTDYTYDALGRLTFAVKANNAGACRAAGQWAYGYDAVGNRLTETGHNGFASNAWSWTSSYDANDRLTAVTGTGPFFLPGKVASYEYDAAGNVTKKTEPDVNGTPQETTYTWDAEGRMVATLVKFNTSGGNTAPQPKPIQYIYDPEGQLVREVREAVVGQVPPAANVTLYLADRNRAFSQILEERDGAGVLSASYLYADSTPIRMVRGTTASYYHLNHLSVEFLSNAAGNTEDTYQYTPYGEQWVHTGSGTSGLPNITNPVRFAGERLNNDTGLYYNRARWVDPRAGRFLGADPRPPAMGQPRTLNRLSYALGDPINYADPSGESALGMVMTVATVAIIASNAYSFLQDPSVETAVDAASSHPTVWGALFVIEGAALASETASSIMALRAGRSLKTLPGAAPRHHSIPKNFCGSDKNQGLVRVDSITHQLLHIELAAYATALEMAGSRIHKRFVKSNASKDKLKLTQIGKNYFGRVGIVAALAGFYQLFDYWPVGMSHALHPGTQVKYDSIGDAFKVESGRFIQGVHDCK